MDTDTSLGEAVGILGPNTYDTPNNPGALDYIPCMAVPPVVAVAVGALETVSALVLVVPSKQQRNSYTPTTHSPSQIVVVFEKSLIGAEISLFSLKNLSHDQHDFPPTQYRGGEGVTFRTSIITALGVDLTFHVI